MEPHVDDGADDLAYLTDGARTGELVGDLPARPTGLWRRWCRRRRSCGGGGVVEDAVEEEAVRRRSMGGAWRGGSECGFGGAIEG